MVEREKVQYLLALFVLRLKKQKIIWVFFYTNWYLSEDITCEKQNTNIWTQYMIYQEGNQKRDNVQTCVGSSSDPSSCLWCSSLGLSCASYRRVRRLININFNIIVLYINYSFLLKVGITKNIYHNYPSCLPIYKNIWISGKELEKFTRTMYVCIFILRTSVFTTHTW